MRFKKWTEEELKRLREGVNRFSKWKAVSEYIGGRTIKQCTDKAYSLGLRLRAADGTPNLSEYEVVKFRRLAARGLLVQEIAALMFLERLHVIMLARKHNVKIKVNRKDDLNPSIIDDSPLGMIPPPRNVKVTRELASGVDWALHDSRNYQ